MADYKLLDPNRKAVLRLPHLAFKLWMTYFMSESDDQEAYLSNEVIEKRSGLSENTIIKWRKWLVKRGWLRPCGGTAAERYSKATRGAHQVLIYRVDDPTRHTLTSNSEGDAELPTAKDATANVIPPKFADKVYVSGSVSASRYGSGSSSSYATNTCGKPVSDLASLREDEKQQQEQQPRRLRSVHKYDAPFPEGFNDDPSEVGVKFRSEWCETHRLDKDGSSRPKIAESSVHVATSKKPAVDWLDDEELSAPPTPPDPAAPPPTCKQCGKALVWHASWECECWFRQKPPQQEAEVVQATG